jgi:hypothetical protein
LTQPQKNTQQAQNTSSSSLSSNVSSMSSSTPMSKEYAFCKNLESKIQASTEFQIGYVDTISTNILPEDQEEAKKYVKSTQSFECDTIDQPESTNKVIGKQILLKNTALGCYRCDGNESYIDFGLNDKINSDPLLSSKKVTNENNITGDYNQYRVEIFNTNYVTINFKIGEKDFYIRTGINLPSEKQARVEADLMKIFDFIE